MGCSMCCCCRVLSFHPWGVMSNKQWCLLFHACAQPKRQDLQELAQAPRLPHQPPVLQVMSEVSSNAGALEALLHVGVAQSAGMVHQTGPDTHDPAASRAMVECHCLLFEH